MLSRFVVCLCSLFIGISLTANAGTVTTSDGSTIHGQVVQVKDGKLTLETGFAGNLEIPLEKITYIDSDETLNIQLGSGNRLVGTLQRSDETTTIVTTNGPVNVSTDTIDVTWQEGEKDPKVVELESQKRDWRYEAFLDLNGRSGNKKEFNLGAGIKAIMEGPDDRLELYLNGKRTETEEQLTSKEIIGGLDFEQRFGKRHSWYLRIEQEYDEIEMLDLRSTIAAGYGYYFLNEEHHKLRGRLGTFYRHESWQVREDESTFGLDAGLYHMYQFENKWRLTTDITYTPSFDDPSGEYRLLHESKFIIPLAHPAWKLQMGVRNEYNTPTSDDVENLDTYYFARLVLNWD